MGLSFLFNWKDDWACNVINPSLCKPLFKGQKHGFPTYQAFLPLKTKVFISLISIVTDTSCHFDGTINLFLLRLLDSQSPTNPKPTNSIASSLCLHIW
ncbi:hypothetical protein Gotur_036067, partial [Gossypium turneri]